MYLAVACFIACTSRSRASCICFAQSTRSRRDNCSTVVGMLVSITYMYCTEIKDRSETFNCLVWMVATSRGWKAAVPHRTKSAGHNPTCFSSCAMYKFRWIGVSKHFSGIVSIARITLFRAGVGSIGSIGSIDRQTDGGSRSRRGARWCIDTSR